MESNHFPVDVSHIRSRYTKRPLSPVQDSNPLPLFTGQAHHQKCLKGICTPMKSRTPTAKVRSLAHFPLCYERICVTYWSRTNLFALKGQGGTALLRSLLCSVRDSNSLPEFGRLACNHKHLLCVDTSGFEPNLLSANQVILPFDLTTRAGHKSNDLSWYSA
jgi:hypothetical protein